MNIEGKILPADFEKTSVIDLNDISTSFEIGKEYWYISSMSGRVSSGIYEGLRSNIDVVVDNQNKVISQRSNEEMVVLRNVHVNPQTSVNEVILIKPDKIYPSQTSLLRSIGATDSSFITEKDEYTFSEYQRIAMSKTYGKGEPIIYPALKLNGGAGEVAEKVGKVLRDDNGVFTEEKKIEIAKELGNVLWYVMAVATDMGIDLAQVAKMNISKITKRRAEGKTHGSGDNR